MKEIERAVVLMAYVVVTHGPAYSPVLEYLEQELAAARDRNPVARAQRLLENYTLDGGRNAMRLSHRTF
ncbi:hypothetical protein [Pseudorhodoplanes sp.]|uniref:hypothetical protein n=1 Tax=Pseudorhodoplanes sp. TaxID=1934341 RepID=UPI002C10EA20|nr:hypothetical protein [Pseudorhodoplanes sp.]HWV40551.1 hypothetical protein [Pseudorhodoplanes sp.]